MCSTPANHGGHRDFHALNYLQNAYIQLGRYRDAKRLTEIFKAEYDGLASKQTAPDTPVLQAKHVKGRTIFGLPDRVVYGYFDVLTRYLIETGDWQSFSKIPAGRAFARFRGDEDASSRRRPLPGAAMRLPREPRPTSSCSSRKNPARTRSSS